MVTEKATVITVKFSQELLERMAVGMSARGYEQMSAYIRFLVEQEARRAEAEA